MTKSLLLSPAGNMGDFGVAGWPELALEKIF